MLVHNLEEIIVHSANDIFKIMKRALSKRKTAETKLNSRSRCVCLYALFVLVIIIVIIAIDLRCIEIAIFCLCLLSIYFCNPHYLCMLAALFFVSYMLKRKHARIHSHTQHTHSRSHCIFTITIHTKVPSACIGGDDIIKVGKLNLVDLAGSECVGRSTSIGTAYVLYYC